MKNTLFLFTFALFSLSITAQKQTVLWHSGGAAADVVDWCGEITAVAAQVAEALITSPEAEAVDLVVDAAAEVTAAIAEEFEDHDYGSPHPVHLDYDKMIQEGGYHWQGGDGDIIYMKAIPNGNQTLYFCQPKGHWWKGIVVFNKSDTKRWAEIAYVSGSDFAVEVPWNTAAAEDHYITLSKAKTFGVHSNMYVVTNWGDAPKGYNYHLYWLKT